MGNHLVKPFEKFLELLLYISVKVVLNEMLYVLEFIRMIHFDVRTIFN